MEIRLPIQERWTRIHYRHDEIEVQDSPIPWQIIKSPR